MTTYGKKYYNSFNSWTNEPIKKKKKFKKKEYFYKKEYKYMYLGGMAFNLANTAIFSLEKSSFNSFLSSLYIKKSN